MGSKIQKRRSQKCPPGYHGNLSQSQEAKLRAIWAIGFKFIEIWEADEATHAATTVEEKYVPPAKMPGRLPKGKGKSKMSATQRKYPTLVKELLDLLPEEEINMEKVAKQAVEALDNWTPHMYHLIVSHVVKHEHPDELALRFLRACNWDLIKAMSMMGKAIYWRTMEAAIDDHILKPGEAGAVEDEKNGIGMTRTMGVDFMKQMRWGKSFIHGTDRAGRPINYLRVRLHRSSDQCIQSLEKYTAYLLELARLSLKHPIETGTILIDLTGFTFSNFDLGPLKYLIKCAEANYPESIGLILLHNAPFGLKSLWTIVRLWIKPSLAEKVKFTRGAKGLRRWISPDQIIKELGGDEEWEYEYVEPQPDENIKMQDIEARDRLLEERRVMAVQFEDITKEWVMSAQLSEKASEIRYQRDRLAGKLSRNYWELDPHVRARSLYDRLGYFRGGAGVDWYPNRRSIYSVESASTFEKLKSVDSGPAAYHYEDA